MHQSRFRLGVRLERGRRKDHPGNRRAALRQVVDDAIERVETAEHGNAADALALIRR